MKNMKKQLSIVMTFVFLVTGITFNVVDGQAAVKINKKSISIKVGKTYKLKVKGTKKKVKWSSSNKKVATVSSKGVVKGKKAGKATITAKVGKKKYKCKVTVTAVKKNTPSTNNTSTTPQSTPVPTPIPVPTQVPSNVDTVSTDTLAAGCSVVVEKLSFSGDLLFTVTNTNKQMVQSIKINYVMKNSQGKALDTDYFTLSAIEAGKSKQYVALVYDQYREEVDASKTEVSKTVDNESGLKYIDLSSKIRDDLKISPTAFEDCTATIHYIDPEIPSTPLPETTDEPEPTAEPTNTLNPDEPTVPTASPTIEPTDTPAPEEPSVPSTSEPAPIPNDGSTPVPDLAMPTPIPVQNNISTSSSGIIPTAAPTGSENFNQELLAINGFHVKLTEKNYVSLSWSMNQYVSGYRIYRAKKKTGTYKMIKGLSETAVTYTDKKAGKNKTYYYKMEAFRTFPNKIVTGKRTSAGSVRIPAFTAPRIVIQKRKMGKIRFISIQFKKFKGKYADIYVAQGGKKFKKLKLVSSKIAKYKKK